MYQVIGRFFSILSIDDCDRSGDHENYFINVTEAYEIDGTKYTNCEKKAVTYRSKNEHKPISQLTQNTFLLFDGKTYVPVFFDDFYDNKEIIHPKFS